MITGQEPGNFHIIILNDNLDKAYSELRDFISQNMEEKERGMLILYNSTYSKSVHFVPLLFIARFHYYY